MMSEVETSTDAFLGGALLLAQPKRGYRAGIDPVLLAATCAAATGARVLDCGAGVGTVGLCVARRLAGVAVTLVERDPTYARLARANCASNDLADRIDVIEADLTAPLARTPALAAQVGKFDHALANPPFHIDADGTRAADALKDAANAMPADALDGWMRFMAAMLRPGGTATVIHRADALAAVLVAFERRFGGVVVRPIQARPDKAANRILVRGSKDSRAPLTLAPALIVHHAGGGYTAGVAQVLRAGAALPLLPELEHSQQ